MIPYTSSRLSNDAEIVCRKSWTRYVLNLAETAPMVVACAAVAYYLYSHLELRSACLCVDADGVWEAGGMLPWAKGVRGVKWDDLDEAAYSMGFWGWLFNSHRVVIRHRYKRGYEIALDDMRAGVEAAVRINAMHKSSLGLWANSGPIAADCGEDTDDERRGGYIHSAEIDLSGFADSRTGPS